MKAYLLSFLAFLLVAITATAQTSKISGKVVDNTGAPVAGASVIIEGTKTGASTGEDGLFSIPVKEGTGSVTLSISSKGFKAAIIKASPGSMVNVTMERETSDMDEVVVVGYGKVKKKDLVSTVATIGGKELTKAPVTSAAEAMTGKLAGVQVTSTEGSPDAQIKIRVRGGGSISQDNSPLFVVDGFIVSDINGIAPSDIQSISVLKDASSAAIYGARGANGVVLITTKDGKAGKISVAANAYYGVKKVAKMLDVLNPYEYVMYQYEAAQGNLTNFQKYYGNFQDLDIYKSKQGTDWQNEMFGRTAQQQYYNLGISGGSDKARFNLGLTRNKEESIMLGSGYERNNVNFKLNTELSKKFSFDLNTRLAYMVIDGAGVNTSAGGQSSKLRNAVKFAPVHGLKEYSSDPDADQDNPEAQSQLFDPVTSTNDEYKKQSKLNTNLGAALNWKIIKNLTFRTEWGYEFRNYRTDQVWGPTTYVSRNGKGGKPVATILNSNGYAWRVANTFTYDLPNIRKNHSLNLLAGQESSSDYYKQVSNTSEQFPVGMKADDVLSMMNFGIPKPTETYISEPDRLYSFFGRANYSFKSKYLASVTFRADGSSKFAPGKQWGYFPSIALAWKLSDENFVKDNIDWISNLKWRASIGAAGNSRIPGSSWKSTFLTIGESKPPYFNDLQSIYLIPGTMDESGKVVNYLTNPDLKWETTITRNTGFDFGLFNGRLAGTVDFYWNTTKDLLITAPLATSSGYDYQLRNMGQTSNRGVELTLEGALVNTKNFSLSASFNIAFNKNKIDKFRNGDAPYKTIDSKWNGSAIPSEDYIIEEGRPVGQMYGYITEGMYSFDDFNFNKNTNKWELKDGVPNVQGSGLAVQNYFGPGILKFKDISGPDGKPDGIINNYDKMVIGNANPKHTGGFGLNSRYKNIDFTAFFNWSYGNDVYNANKMDYSVFLDSRAYQNLAGFMDLSHRFTIIDPETGNNVAYGTNADPVRLQEINKNASIWSPLYTKTPLHSWAIEDGSFLRLNTLTIGYTIPKNVLSKVKIQNIRVYATGYNLYTWTSYSGFDPEVDARRGTPLTPSVDFSAYPKARSFVAGINVTF